jgi:glutathione S-transferase
MKLIGKSTSINVRKVLWTCAVLGIHPEREERGADALLTAAPEFLSLNPNGLVPVLLTEGIALRESNTICRYLATSAGATELLPTEPLRRAQVEMWMDWQATDLNSAWRYAFMHLVRRSPSYPSGASAAASVTEWNRLMDILDAHLASTGAYVTGPTFSLADIVLGLSANRWLLTPMERPRLAAVEAWLSRLSGTRGFREHVQNGEP